MKQAEKLPTDLYADPGMEPKYRVAGIMYLRLPRHALRVVDSMGAAAIWLGQASELNRDAPLIACFEGTKGYWYGNVPTSEATPLNDLKDFEASTFATSILRYAEFETESATSAISVLAGEAVLEAAKERYKNLRTIMYARLLHEQSTQQAAS